MRLRLGNSIALIAAALGFFGASPAQAACINPEGGTGALIYNTEARAAQHCNGNEWIALGREGVPSKGLVGHWKLDEASGTLADSSGNGNNGAQSGGVGYSSAGMIGTALNFDGVNDEVAIAGDPPVDSINALTVATWVKLDTNTAQEDIVLKTHSSAPWFSWQLVSYANEFQFEFFSSGGWGSVGTNTNPQTGVWYHLAAVYNNGNARIYVNGQDDTAWTAGAASGALINTNDDLNISVSTLPVDGQIDDVRIYNRALSAAEVAALYDYGLRDDGLIAHWPLDESGGTAAQDVAGDNDGTASGGVVFGSAGQVGLAAQFDGVDDVIILPASATNALDRFTASIWIKTTESAGYATYWQRPNIFGLKTPGSPDNDFSINSSGGFIGYWHGLHNSSDQAFLSGSTQINDNNWHHAAVTYDGLTTRLYVDGAFQTGSSLPANGEGLVNGSFGIGSTPLNPTEYHQGLFDDARIYGRALSANEIAEIHANGLLGHAAPSCANPTRPEGTIIYNTTHNVMQYCNGIEWVAMGPSPGAGGGGCANPARSKGSIFYDPGRCLIQYCDGANWTGMGGREEACSGPADPTNLEIKGSVTNAQLNGASDVAVSGGYAYVTAYDGDRLTVVDISNPAAPAIVGSVTSTQLDAVNDIAVSGNYAYLAAYDGDRLTVVDISNPATPTIAGSVTDAQLDGAAGVAVVGNYAYVTAYDGDRLTVVDISNPATPMITGSVQDATQLNGANFVAVSGSYAYLTAYESDRLTVVDISNPATPTIAGSVTDAQLDGAAGVVVVGNYAYVTAFGADRLTVVDISNPAAPAIVGSVTSTQLDAVNGIAVSGNYAYLAAYDGDRLTVVDISNPATPTITESVTGAEMNGAYGVAVSGNYAYVTAFGADRLVVIGTP